MVGDPSTQKDVLKQAFDKVCNNQAKDHLPKHDKFLQYLSNDGINSNSEASSYVASKVLHFMSYDQYCEKIG